MLICGEDIEPDSPFVEGWIKRVAPKTSSISKANEPNLELVKSLAKAGLWFDTMSSLVELRKSQPNNSELMKVWKTLLEDKHVGLTDFSEQPIINENLTN